jgi:choline dehydrogenase
MDSFDYIIVGAGTAGCVVAERLSASGRDRVLLLEAGGSDRRIWIRLPIGYGRTFNDPAVNWMYETEPEAALLGSRSYWPRGKVLGGSGSINAMVYVRGQPADYDDWRSLGNPGWGWSDVLPHFLSIEGHARPAGATSVPALRVTDITGAAHPLCRSYLESCAALGFGFTADFNGDHPEGVGLYRINTRHGCRDSTATAFLRPALRRRNLTLQLHTMAQRVDFEGRRATGVTCRRHGQTLTLRAHKAVILSAGSINSPQLLQLSGVGPAALLRRHGIEPVLDAPAVGQNLRDHLAISYFYRSRVPTLNNRLHPLWGKAWAALQYLLTRGGPLSMSVNQGGGFVRTDPGQPAPNLQLYCNPASYTGSRERSRKLMNPDPFPAFLLSFNACRPTSQGRLEIRSADPSLAPAIYPQYLSTQKDVNDVLAGMRLLRQLAATAPLAGLIESEMLPGAHNSTAAQLLQDFRRRAGSVFHPVGTCSMGQDSVRSVVDARLRVHGIDGLRVIDASVFPTLTSGNTNAPTAMVADRGAAMVLRDG